MRIIQYLSWNVAQLLIALYMLILLIKKIKKKKKRKENTQYFYKYKAVDLCNFK